MRENVCPIFRRKTTSTDYFVSSSVNTALGAVVGKKKLVKKAQFIITCIIGGGSSSKGPIT